MSDDKFRELAQMQYAQLQLQGNEVDVVSIATPCHGMLRYIRPDTQEMVYVKPNEPTFSTAIIYADEMYNEDTKQWESFP